MPPATLTLNDGTKAPWIAFGTGTTFFGKDKGAKEAVIRAIANGFTHIDTAQQYKNEDLVGDGIAASGKPRSELYITTKLRVLGPKDTPESELKKSLAKLKVEYVDLYLIHQPGAAGRHTLEDVWKGMEDAQKAGLTKSIGVSNFGAVDLQKILKVAKIHPAVNQVEAHPFVWNNLGPTLEIHRAPRIVTSSYGGLSPLFRGPEASPLKPVIEQIRERLGKAQVSEGQVLHKWLQQKGVLVVTTSSKVERLKEYLATENVPNLTQEDIDLIGTTGAIVDMPDGFFPPDWYEDPNEE